MKNFKTNKLFKLLFSGLLMGLMTLPVNVFASTNLNCQAVIKPSTKELVSFKKTVEEFALKNILKIANETPDQGWTENTKISDSIITYDLDGNINGCILNLETKKNQSGYIQILKSNNEYYVISYTFQGRHYLDKMIASYKTKKNSFNDKCQVIYNGNIDFLINEDVTQNNKYYSLTKEQTMKYDKSELKIKYNKIEKNIIENNLSTDGYSLSKSLGLTATASVTGVKKYVLNANNADLVECSDFAGQMLNGEPVDNHCSPTVGTNLVKYWANRRGVSNLYHWSDWWVFSSLCVNMHTNFNTGMGLITGTTDTNFYYGLQHYSTYTRGISFSGADWWGNTLTESCTFAKAKSIIDANVPFDLSLSDHSMACFGYDTTNGERLIVNTGWDKYWTFQLFSTFDIDNYIYVRWN